MAKLVKCKTCGQEIAKSAKVCPHCGAKQKKHVVLIVVALFFCIIIILCAVFANGNDTESGQNNSDILSSANVESISTNPPAPTEETAISISAEDLYSAYIANAVNADNLYKDKILAVTGVVSDIGQDMVTKKPCVSLSSGDGLDIFPVQCFFSESSDELAALADGDTVTITGKCTGYNVAFVQLTRCKLN